jgi:hypothetical protein
MADNPANTGRDLILRLGFLTEKRIQRMAYLTKCSIKKKVSLGVEIGREQPMLNSFVIQEFVKPRPHPIRSVDCTVPNPQINFSSDRCK